MIYHHGDPIALLDQVGSRLELMRIELHVEGETVRLQRGVPSAPIRVLEQIFQGFISGPRRLVVEYLPHSD
jgi:hypothetical protein